MKKLGIWVAPVFFLAGCSGNAVEEMVEEPVYEVYMEEVLAEEPVGAGELLTKIAEILAPLEHIWRYDSNHDFEISHSVFELMSTLWWLEIQLSDYEAGTLETLWLDRENFQSQYDQLMSLYAGDFCADLQDLPECQWIGASLSVFETGIFPLLENQQDPFLDWNAWLNDDLFGTGFTIFEEDGILRIFHHSERNFLGIVGWHMFVYGLGPWSGEPTLEVDFESLGHEALELLDEEETLIEALREFHTQYGAVKDFQDFVAENPVEMPLLHYANVHGEQSVRFFANWKEVELESFPSLGRWVVDDVPWHRTSHQGVQAQTVQLWNFEVISQEVSYGAFLNAQLENESEARRPVILLTTYFVEVYESMMDSTSNTLDRIRPGMAYKVIDAMLNWGESEVVSQVVEDGARREIIRWTRIEPINVPNNIYPYVEVTFENGRVVEFVTSPLGAG